jgi:hypothetical protein
MAIIVRNLLATDRGFAVCSPSGFVAICSGHFSWLHMETVKL